MYYNHFSLQLKSVKQSQKLINESKTLISLLHQNAAHNTTFCPITINRMIVDRIDRVLHNRKHSIFVAMVTVLAEVLFKLHKVLNRNG